MPKKTTEKKEELKAKSLYIRGTLVDAMYGARSFSKGKDAKEKYRISIKAVNVDMEELVKEAEPFYENVDEKWLPKWYSDEASREYLNLSSNFDIKAGLKKEDGTIEELGGLIDYISDNGNINGSKVIVLVTLKEGAIYPQSILIKELRKVTMSDMFADFADELPF